ncbi:MAG: membrane protein insertion efficiency factor YidD [Ruminococcaceae bacterium]|nr:membrane protein insertion efficiency factor YidD [Oscillospiraceae bacterium]MEE1198787.1 membrane protein insertion efficiency factor YidD [Acutalibacteraceae bacterium]
MGRLFIRLIRFYQKNISPMKISCCRFQPTCSNYAIEAIKVHGAFKGFFLAVWRILRCNPFCRGGYDPVPPKKEKNNHF